MFIDRDIAKKEFLNLVSSLPKEWIIISGKRKIGKTAFAKHVAEGICDSFYCCPKYEIIYFHAIVASVCDMCKDIIISYLKQNKSNSQEIYNIMGIHTLDEITDTTASSYAIMLIKNDIDTTQYKFTQFLGGYLSHDISYLILDDFYKCERLSYEWLLQFARFYNGAQGKIIVICDFTYDWKSNSVKNIFENIFSPINIEQFDNEKAYYDVLEESIYFENGRLLSQISTFLFKEYKGNAYLLFETIKQLREQQTYTDSEKIKIIHQIANRMTLKAFENLKQVDFLVLGALSISPISLSLPYIEQITGIAQISLQEILTHLYDLKLVDMVQNNQSKTIDYIIYDEQLKDAINDEIPDTKLKFLYSRFYHICKINNIPLSTKYLADCALYINEAQDIIPYVTAYIDEAFQNENMEKACEYIDKLILSIKDVPAQYTTLETADWLYKYGYYKSALNIINMIERQDNFKKTYEFLMTKGNIQHLLLDQNTAVTYKEAVSMSSTDIDKKLRAINRRIMALTQKDVEQAKQAKELYENTIQQYSKEKCIGLVELYRNANNIYSYSKAMDYTIRGYELAVELNHDLEKYKNLHNICMLKLHNGTYEEPLNNKVFVLEPSFEEVISFFSSNAMYTHELAYPLLDLGTLFMFKYVNELDNTFLLKAKEFYSEGQLYAKSFYAQYIAEMGLLIANSYVYKSNGAGLKDARCKIFEKYSSNKNNIADHRVHRKILLSLATSASITGDNEEGVQYMHMVRDYMIGSETLRYNNLCNKLGISDKIKEVTDSHNEQNTYYANTNFVPWLISFGH